MIILSPRKTIKHASADVGFIFIAYNLKRILNILGIEALIKHCAKYLALIAIIRNYIFQKTQIVMLMIKFQFLTQNINIHTKSTIFSLKPSFNRGF